MISMSADVFLDSNVLVYASSTDPDEAAKKSLAREILDSRNFGISTQVLQEFYVTVTRKIKRRLQPREAVEFMDSIADRPILAADYKLVLRAIDFEARFGISYWDAAIVAAANELHAKILYTEDLNHEQFYGDVQAINPFVSLARR
jgi:predicted nucleic acid-binding protein